MNAQPSDLLLSVYKAAEHTGLSVATLYRYIDKGYLHPVITRVGKKKLRVAELDAMDLPVMYVQLPDEGVPKPSQE